MSAESLGMNPQETISAFHRFIFEPQPAGLTNSQIISWWSDRWLCFNICLMVSAFTAYLSEAGVHSFYPSLYWLVAPICLNILFYMAPRAQIAMARQEGTILFRVLLYFSVATFIVIR